MNTGSQAVAVFSCMRILSLIMAMNSEFVGLPLALETV